MNLKFWKKKPKAGDEGEDEPEIPDAKMPEADVQDVPPDQEKRGGMKAKLANFLQRFKKIPQPEAEEDSGLGKQDGAETGASEDNLVIKSIRSKKRLIIAGAIGLLILILAGIGFAAWKIFFSHPKPDAHPPATAETSHTALPETHAKQPLSELEALKKKNEELQAQIEALKKSQPPGSSQTQEAGGNSDAPQAHGSNDHRRRGSRSRPAQKLESSYRGDECRLGQLCRKARKINAPSRNRGRFGKPERHTTAEEAGPDPGFAAGPDPGLRCPDHLVHAPEYGSGCGFDFCPAPALPRKEPEHPEMTCLDHPSHPSRHLRRLQHRHRHRRHERRLPYLNPKQLQEP